MNRQTDENKPPIEDVLTPDIPLHVARIIADRYGCVLIPAMAKKKPKPKPKKQKPKKKRPY